MWDVSHWQIGRHPFLLAIQWNKGNVTKRNGELKQSVELHFLQLFNVFSEVIKRNG